MGLKVLVLGASGFIGRNMVSYLRSVDGVDFVRGADKVLLQTAFLSAEHQAAFDDDKVEFKQANLTSAASIERTFTIESGGEFDVVINCAAETKYSQSDEVYAEKILDLSVKCATEAAKRKIGKFIEFSTAQVYAAGSKSSTEDSKTAPWTGVATFKLRAEEALKAISGLNLIIVRPATVYGPGDVSGVMPRLICGRVYKKLNKTMKFLWTGGLRLNTVHVDDVCAGTWLLATQGTVGETYNMVDDSDTTAESLNKPISEIFGIKTGFQGTIVSNLAKINMAGVIAQVNDEHMTAWSEICKETSTTQQLSPYLDAEMLKNNALSCDATKLKGVGWTLKHPKLTADLLKASLEYFSAQNLFPKD